MGNGTTYSKLFKEVTKQKALDIAWKHVRKNGLKSKSKETRDKIAAFDQNYPKKIKELQAMVRKGQCKFSAKGVPIKKKSANSSPRPLVIMSVENSIIQRSILNILQKEKGMQKYLISDTSFGGMKGRGKGVPGAINKICEHIENGRNYFVRSDIKSFFTKIPLDDVIKQISQVISAQPDFIKLLSSALKLEINNIKNLKKPHRELFDFEMIGTPQGCSLSPLIANIFLYDFDLKMNQENLFCIRYLDDFIILADSQKVAIAGLKKARKILSALSLEIHDPEAQGVKASQGFTKSKFEFLGIEFNLGNYYLAPTKEAITSFKKDIYDIMKDSLKHMDNIKKREHSMISVLMLVSNKINGWGKTFSKSCGKYLNKSLWGSIDHDINKMVFEYIEKVISTFNDTKNSPEKKRVLIGIHTLLSDKKSS